MQAPADRPRRAQPDAVLIAGPTASGKSALALACAKATGGVVVNADSMQVYRDLQILTARPSARDEAEAGHWLYGHVDGDADYSVGRWLDDAAAALAALREAGRLPILVGGTGLYFKALTQGLAPVPPIPDAVRLKIRMDTIEDKTPVLHSRLATRDPETAFRLKPNDRQRILRALEVLEATGRPLSAWQKATGPGLIAEDRAVRVVIDTDRDSLKARIDTRFDAMIETGALREVVDLMRRGLPAGRPILKAHGVPALFRHLMGEISLSEAIEIGKADTRRYAKRQETWFRHQMADWPRAPPEAALQTILRVLG
ncbi:tRNA (adenosine(37)-N6)-dimethylallyltransferase MiaA [Aquabacter spiritensis]|uniref:tRNA dimethylallyltransferase n=1 Tax=Aquabacter spiritensis TaxID=933073 RepID=A0A4R3LPR7_9HYPH|nr:tRNA (adenosine(37)-N6)-dimethylallyltransferase MiaA [Aquabacter spiritensis]TCT02483.1 tRNA dimethylallyltransferase [Aquabacter spiritensis]